MRLPLRLGASVLLALTACAGRAQPSDWLLPHPTDPILDRLVQEERYAEAMGHAIAVVRSRAEGPGPMAPTTLASLELLGRAACEAGEYATGEAILEAALRASRRVLGPDDPRLATSWIALGRVARIKGQRELAWRRYQEARQLLEGRGEAWEAVRSELEQGEGNWHRKADMDKALALYRQSVERQRRVSPWGSFEEAEKLTWMGWMLGRMGRFEEAERRLLSARSQLRALGLAGHSLNGVIDNAFAERLALEGRWEEAESFFRRVTEIFTVARMNVPPGFARRVRPLDGHEALALLELRRGRGEEAWMALQRSRAAVHLDFARLGLWSQRDPEGFRDAQLLRRELLGLRRTLAGMDPDVELSWTPDTWRSILRFVEGWRRLSDLQARYLHAFPPQEASLARVRAMLGAKSALLGVVEVALGGDPTVGDQRLRKEGWLYVLRRSGPIVWEPLPELEGRDAIRLRSTWQRTLRAAFWPLHVDPDPEVVADHRAYARRYLDPALPHLAGIEHLVVEGSLIPYEILIGPNGRPTIDLFDVTHVPSAHVATMLAERWENEPVREVRSILSLSAAAPRPGTETLERLASASGVYRDLRRPRSSFTRSEIPPDGLPSLPYAAVEASLVARKFPAATLLQGAGVEQRLHQIESGEGLGRFDVVHFAGHSLTDGSPELAGLALARHDAGPGPLDDEILDVEEILLGWDLDARLLTLSGCETARAAGAERGEVLGFTPALFAAGARSVLSSLWPVDDQATALLMDRFYDNLTGRYADVRMGERGVPLPTARALREAKIHLRNLVDDHGRRPFEHPVYWGGFILLGLPEER